MDDSNILLEGIEIAIYSTDSTQLYQQDARVDPFAAAFDSIGAIDVLERVKYDVATLSGMVCVISKEEVFLS